MAEANLTAIMDGLAARAGGLAVNVYPYPVDVISVPCVIVGYPSVVEFDATYSRGSDRVVLPVWYAVGKAFTKASRDALSAALTGGSSMKSQLDGPTTGFGDVRCTEATVDEIRVGDVPYVALRVECEVLT